MKKEFHCKVDENGEMRTVEFSVVRVTIQFHKAERVVVFQRGAILTIAKLF